MKNTINTARTLRRNQTDAEKLLWSHLRGSRLKNYKFRRQHPIHPYIADFFCEQKNIVVEVDGGQHTPETDAKRSAFIKAQGYKIIRFWNNDVLTNIDGVLTEILIAMDDTEFRKFKTPHPAPLPVGEGIYAAPKNESPIRIVKT